MPIFASPSTTPDDERQLLARLSGNDEDAADRAMGEIMARYQTVVEQTAWRVVHDRDTVLDIAQNVWLTCWQTRQTLVIRAGFREYLVCTTRTRALNWRRGERRKHWLAQKLANWRTADGEDIVENDAVHQLAAADQEYLVRVVVSAMPPRRRDVYEYVTQDGYTHDEVARLLNMSPRTVSNQMWQANQAIHRALTQGDSAAEAC